MDDCCKSMQRTNSADELKDMIKTKEPTGNITNFIDKTKIVSYVLVPNESQSTIMYYAGFFIPSNCDGVLLSHNTVNYDKAAKFCFRDEAEDLCNIINGLKCPFKYHVEEHMYS